MKKVKMLKTMANSKMSASAGQIIKIEDAFATVLIEAKACEVIEDIQDVEFTEVIEETTEEVKEVEKAVKKTSKKRK